ncbi:MAG: hypothetical protein ABJN22_01740 [Litorimonas sp.]
MGDDLIFAQKFTRTAADGLALLVEMEDPRAAHEASVVIDMMTTVQRGAKRLRARHIYSGAQGVLSALHHENDATLEGRIESLGSLVTEYARGLDELLQTADAAPATTPSDKWDMARENLNALLPIASSDDADMLSRLMRAPVTLETVQPEQDPILMDADIVPFVKAETPDEVEGSSFENLDPLDALPTAEVNSTEDTVSRPVEPKIEDGPSIALDAMMRDVIADALSVARTVGRTISLSYDMGDRAVSETHAANLQSRLGQALSQIIRQSLKEGRVGHIDINLAGEQLHIMAGTTAVRVAIDPENAPKKPAPKPLITDETEQGLRAQLNALMDPIPLHETAS